MVTQAFPSRIDTWLLALIVGSAVAAAVAVLVTLRTVPGSVPGAIPVSVFILVVGVVLPVWILAGTRYVLDDATLRIRCGPFRWSVPLAEIESVVPTRNPLSSPALSLDRLAIRYRNGRAIMISPADRDGFLRALAERRGTARNL